MVKLGEKMKNTHTSRSFHTRNKGIGLFMCLFFTVIHLVEMLVLVIVVSSKYSIPSFKIKGKTIPLRQKMSMLVFVTYPI
jgi:hypothetical protein